MTRYRQLRAKIVRGWHAWMLKKRMALAARELEYGRRLVEWAELEALRTRRDLAYLECPPTVYDCAMRVVPRAVVN